MSKQNINKHQSAQNNNQSGASVTDIRGNPVQKPSASTFTEEQLESFTEALRKAGLKARWTNCC
jgi:hypothetical protein